MRKILTIAALLSAMTLMGCPSTPEIKNYETEHNEEYAITYLLSNFESMDGKNTETIYKQAWSGDDNPNYELGGYFYTYNDPKNNVADITPFATESSHCKGVGVDTDALPQGCNFGSGLKENESNPFTLFDSKKSLHVSGTTAGDGVGFGVYFYDKADDDGVRIEGGKVPKKLGTKGQEGLVFWGMGKGKIEISLNMPGVTPMADGGTCNLEEGEKCYDYHKVIIELDGAWREYWTAWDEFNQEGWGKPIILDPDTFENIQFKVTPPKSGGLSEDFDFWIDHVGFYGGETWDFVTVMTDTENQ